MRHQYLVGRLFLFVRVVFLKVNLTGVLFPVPLGSEFYIDVDGANTEFTIQSDGGVQTISIHTSCSVPLRIGDVFGGVVVVGFDNERLTDCPPPPPPPPGVCVPFIVDICESSKPKVLIMQCVKMLLELFPCLH